MDFPFDFNMGLGGLASDGIVSRIFGRNQYTPQTDALLAAPDTGSMPAGSPPPAPQMTTPNPSMRPGGANITEGLFGSPQNPSMGRGLAGMAHVSARYWLETDGNLDLDVASDLIYRLAWRGISRFPKET